MPRKIRELVRDLKKSGSGISTFGLQGPPQPRNGRSSVTRWRVGWLLEPRGVVGIWKRPNRYVKHLKRTPIWNQKGQLAQSDPKKEQQIATANDIKLFIELCFTACQIASMGDLCGFSKSNRKWVGWGSNPQPTPFAHSV